MNALRQQLRSLLRVQPHDHGFRAQLTVDPAFSILPDHFPGNPILPGMCMVQAVLLAAAAAQGLPDLRLALLKNAKFLHPVEPGDQVVLDGHIAAASDHNLSIKAKLSVGPRAVAEFSLLARPPEVEGATP
jgi:3-hydroxymyristoyl/3-hydroxydecanoyl-(acyl carrier protein) dehydratase